MTTNRELAKSVTIGKDYFYHWNTRRYTWVPYYVAEMRMDEVICTEPGCQYVPRRDSTQPRRAYRSHVKKAHPIKWFTDFARPFIIHEEPDFAIGLAHA